MTHSNPEQVGELAIADDNAPLPPAHRPTRWTVRRGRSIAFVLLGLALAAGLLSVYYTYETAQGSVAQAEAVDRRLSVLEDDLADRTRQRDAERDAAAAQAEADREQFRARFCDVLTELSATFPNLEQLRQALGCPSASVPSAAPPAGVPPATPPVEVPPAASVAPSPGSGAPPPARSPASPPRAVEPPPDAPGGDGLVCRLLPVIC